MMGKTIRNFKGIEYPDKSIKDKGDVKQFVYRGDGWSTKARGGVGNKRAWKGPIPKWLFMKYKEKELVD